MGYIKGCEDSAGGVTETKRLVQAAQAAMRQAAENGHYGPMLLTVFDDERVPDTGTGKAAGGE